MARKLIILVALAATLVLSSCAGEGMYSGSLVTQGSHRIGNGSVVNGDLLVLDGDLVIEEGARVTGSVYQLSGTVRADGEIGRDLSILGGSLTLGPRARVAGDLSKGGGTLEQSPTAEIGGKSQTGAEVTDLLAPWSRRSTAERVWESVGRAILMAALAAVAARFAPGPVARVAQAAVHFPMAAGALGVLSGVVGLVLLVFMAFTIILIPVTVLSLLLLAALVAYGLVALGSALGRRLANALKWRLPAALAAAFGTLLLMLLSDVCALIPIAGEVLPLMAVSVGLGAVLLTRLGSQRFVPEVERQEV